MNLTNIPWLQATTVKNRLVEVSLTEALTQAHTLTAVLGQTPLERVALLRFLLAVLYRACQPETENEAQRQYQTGQFDADRLKNYFAMWQKRFCLFDPDHPFYQVAHPPASLKPSNVNRLFLSYTTGIKSTLHNHNHDDATLNLTPAQAARAVISAQTFLTAGGNSGRPDLMFHHTPPLQQSNFIIHGATLFQTLWLHLFPKEGEQGLAPFFHNTWPTTDDCPVWERDHPEQPPRQQPQGPLDVLTYPGRLVKLMPEYDQTRVNRAIITQGLWIAPNVPRFDPLAAYRQVKSKNKPVAVYPVKIEAGFLKTPALLAPYTENLAWPVYIRWRKLVEGGVLRPDEFRFAATGVECDSRNVALTHRIYDHWLPIPGRALFNDSQLAMIQQYGQAVATWSYIGAQAFKAGILTLHASRRNRFQAALDLMKQQVRQIAETCLPLACTGQEPLNWEAIVHHLVEQQTAQMPVTAQAAARNKLNHLCAWQRKEQQEANEYANTPT